MSDTNSEENKNKTPEKMARLAWPKAKYGAVLAIIVIIVINIMTIIANTKPYLAFGQAKRAILSGVLFLFSSEFVSGIF